jgi:hypothetical protein
MLQSYIYCIGPVDSGQQKYKVVNCLEFSKSHLVCINLLSE